MRRCSQLQCEITCRRSSKGVNEPDDYKVASMQRVSTLATLRSQVSTADSAQLFAALGIDNSWSFKKFEESFRVVINWVKGMDMEFELIGTSPAIANALRRILIAEVPTMAIEHVFLINNTSIIAVSHDFYSLYTCALWTLQSRGTFDKLGAHPW